MANSLKLVQKIPTDDAKKYLWKARNKYLIESGYFWSPNESTDAMCVSTQIGCSYSCIFCASGKATYEGNLTKDEIIAQIDQMLADNKTDISKGLNIAFFGMGEPTANLEEVIKAIQEIQSKPNKYSNAPEIWVGTRGLSQRIRELAAFHFQKPIRMQFSLHSPWDEKRKKIMPNKMGYPQEPLKELLSAVEYFANKNGGTMVVINYVLMSGINDR